MCITQRFEPARTTAEWLWTECSVYLAHVEGEAEEDQIQRAPLYQHARVLDRGADGLHLVTTQRRRHSASVRSNRWNNRRRGNCDSIYSVIFQSNQTEKRYCSAACCHIPSAQCRCPWCRAGPPSTACDWGAAERRTPREDAQQGWSGCCPTRHCRRPTVPLLQPPSPTGCLFFSGPETANVKSHQLSAFHAPDMTGYAHA